jgi:hypoxanthine phosphoribosyltransferase
MSLDPHRRTEEPSPVLAEVIGQSGPLSYSKFGDLAASCPSLTLFAPVIPPGTRPGNLRRTGPTPGPFDPPTVLPSTPCRGRLPETPSGLPLGTIPEPRPTRSNAVHDDLERVLFTEAEIREGIDRVAAQVTELYRGTDFTVVSVLKGSCIFCADLIRRIPIPLRLSFVAASSYGAGTTAGDLELQYLPGDAELAGKRLLLVDDILDSGQTLHRIKAELLRRGAADVRTCVFLDKPARRAVELEADFRVLQVPDLFVVGYGLDFAGMYRNLPIVGVLKPEVYGHGDALEGTATAS